MLFYLKKMNFLPSQTNILDNKYKNVNCKQIDYIRSNVLD